MKSTISSVSSAACSALTSASTSREHFVAAEIPRVLSAIDCQDLLKRAVGFTDGRGIVRIGIDSIWRGELRFARNTFTTSGDIRNNELKILRGRDGAQIGVGINMVDDIPLKAAVLRAEQMLTLMQEDLGAGDFAFEHFSALSDPQPTSSVTVPSAVRTSGLTALVKKAEPMPEVKLFFEKTYNLPAGERAEAIAPLMEPIAKAGMVAAGFMQVRGWARGLLSNFGQFMYTPSTLAQLSMTVRDPKGMGSGWAGIDWNEWARIDGKEIASIALDKCLRSRNPVKLEPGRYTAILEPQAVGDLCLTGGELDRMFSGALEYKKMIAGFGPYSGGIKRLPKINQRIYDDRITVTSDPSDSDCGFIPFNVLGDVYRPVTWIERGVLKNWAYDRTTAIKYFNKEYGQPAPGAFRMSGGNTSLEEMIATTKRGIYVTRFSDVALLDGNSMLSSGFTRDGLWLIENGKISKPISNFRFTESPVFMLNNIEQLGVPKRIFHPDYPVIVPSMKVRDFSFTSLTSAI